MTKICGKCVSFKRNKNYKETLLTIRKVQLNFFRYRKSGLDILTLTEHTKSKKIKNKEVNIVSNIPAKFA